MNPRKNLAPELSDLWDRLEAGLAMIRHAAASATTPDPINQIRLTTRTPFPASQEVRSQSPPARGQVPFRQAFAEPVPEERPRL